MTPWTAARQAPLSSTISRSLLKLMCIESMMPSSHLILWSLLKLMCIESVMPSSHLILCCLLLLCLPSFPASGSFPVSQAFTSEFRWPKYWSFLTAWGAKLHPQDSRAPASIHHAWESTFSGDVTQQERGKPLPDPSCGLRFWGSVNSATPQFSYLSWCCSLD